MYFVLSIVILSAWSVVQVFVLGKHEPESGGPWDNYVLVSQLSLAISAMSAMGYLVGLQVFDSLLSEPSMVARTSIPVIAAVLLLVVGRTGVVGDFAGYFPLGGVENLMLAFFMVGVFFAGIALLLVSFWNRNRGVT